MSPPPPPRDERSAATSQRAKQALERLNRALEDRKRLPAGEKATTDGSPTDSARAPAQPVGTSWSVIVGSAPAGTKSTAAPSPSPQAAQEDSIRQQDPARRRQWQWPVDIIGGALGAVCCVLALRKRARQSANHVDANL